MPKTETKPSLQSAALDYAKRGFKVFPLAPGGKNPLFAGGYQKATTDPKQITSWWEDYPNANIGCRPEKNLVIVDIDPRNGGELSWEELTLGRKVPPTLTVRTGGGGRHYWFELPHTLAQLNGKIATGIDIKNDRGHVVLPPSVTENPYTLEVDTEPAPLPSWLVDLVYKPVGSTPQYLPQDGANIDGLVEKVANAPHGERNNLLNWALYCAYSDNVSTEGIQRIKDASTLSGNEIERTAESAREAAESKTTGGPKSPLVYPPGADHMGVADCLIRDLWTSQGLQTIYFHNGEWWLWTGTDWSPRNNNQIQQQVQRHLSKVWVKKGDKYQPFTVNRASVTGVMDVLQAEVASDYDHEFLGLLPGRVVFRNGVLDVKTRQLRPHSPMNRNMTTIPYDYNPEAECPEFKAWINEVFAHDPEAVEMIQEYWGYMLQGGEIRHHKGLIITGAPRSGKTTLSNLMCKSLGEANTHEMNLSKLGQRFALEPLVGKSLLLFADSRQNKPLDAESTGILLKIIGNDPVGVEKKNVDPYTARLGVRVLLVSNALPKFNDGGGAIANRWLAARTKKSWLGSEDIDLPRRLEAELPGVILWALDGLKRLEERGRFTEAKTMQDQIERIDDFADIETKFTNEFLEVTGDSDDFVDKRALYELYKDWCSQQGHEPKSSPSLVNALLDQDDRIKDGKDNKRRVGQLYDLGDSAPPVREQKKLRVLFGLRLNAEHRARFEREQVAYWKRGNLAKA